MKVVRCSRESSETRTPGPFFFIFCALGASESKTGGGNKKTKREGRNRVVCEYSGVCRCILYLRSKYGRMHVISRFLFCFLFCPARISRLYLETIRLHNGLALVSNHDRRCQRRKIKHSG